MCCQVPKVRFCRDYAATTLKYFGVEDLDNLAYFDDIMDDTVVNPEEEVYLLQHLLLGVAAETCSRGIEQRRPRT